MTKSLEALIARILKLAAVAEQTNIKESSAPWVAYFNEVCPANVRELIEALETRDKQIVELNTYRARRVSACINACEGISTENLLNNVPLKQGLSGLNQRIRDADAKLESEAKRNAELIAALEQAQEREKRAVKLVMDNDSSWEHLFAQYEASQQRIAELEDRPLCVKSDTMREVAPLCVELSDGWISVSDSNPDPNDSRRVCVFTPSEHEDLRYRFVPASLFKAVCSEATHWHYMTMPGGTVEGSD